MAIYLLLAFVIVPLVEIGLFIQVGGMIGLWPTLGLVIATALAGSALLRAQGFATINSARAALDRNELPVEQVFTGFCLVIAGALLLTPGFFTDAVGLLLFVPGLRDALRRRLFAFLQKRGQARMFVNGMEADPRARPEDAARPRPGVIDADYREVGPDGGDEEVEPPKDSRWRPPHNNRRP